MTLAKLVKARDVKGDTNFDVILRAFLNHKMDSLPAELKVMLERWETADKMLRNLVKVINPDTKKEQSMIYSSRAVAEFLVEQYGIAKRTAWEDIANAKQFFLSCEGRSDIDYARGAQIDLGMKLLLHYHDQSDGKTVAALYKEINDLKGLHRQPEDVPNYDDFQPPAYRIVASPVELGFEPIENMDDFVKQVLGDGRREFLDAEAEDTDYTDAES